MSIGTHGAANPFHIPLDYACYIPPVIAETVLCAVLSHRVLQTVEGLEQERTVLAVALQAHRGEAIRCLASALLSNCSDGTLEAIISLLLCEVFNRSPGLGQKLNQQIQHSMSPKWWQHVDGAFVMIHLRGGVVSFVSSRKPTRPMLRVLNL